MKLIIFHQYFLGKNDSGGSRWNQFSKYFSDKSNVTVIAGNIHYSTGQRISPKILFNKEVISENLRVFRTWTYSGYNVNFIGRLIGYLSYMVSSFIAGLFITKPNAIIVTSPPLFIGLSALFLSKIKRVPFIFEVRDLWPESAITTKVVSNKTLINIMYFIEKALYKNASKIIALTPAFKQDIIERFPEHESKIRIITNGADFDIMKPDSKNNWVREKYNWQNKFIFSYFGAHGVANDLIQIVEVARLFQNNKDILFALIGDGMQKQLLKEKAKEYKLNYVQFIDSIPKVQVADFINASDVCMAVLKKNETFKTVYPNKIFDYMSCKKPILVTIDGITRKLINESECGLFAEPENVKMFKEVVDQFLSMNINELNKYGENGYAYATEHFDRLKLAQKYFEIISQISKN